MSPYPRRCPGSLGWASLSATTACTKRCWAPSWRSRTTRRRAPSPAASRRAREATSCSRPSAFAIAVSSSFANWVDALLAVGRRRLSPVQYTTAMPHSRPSMMIGAPMLERTPGVAGRRPREAVRRVDVLHPGRAPGAAHPRRHALTVVGEARTGRQFPPLESAMGHDGDLVARLVAAQRHPVGVQQPLHLRGHAVEHRGRRGAFGDQRRHPPQRRLLGSDPAIGGIQPRVVERDGELAGDELDQVQPLRRERVADQAVLEHSTACSVPRLTIGTARSEQAPRPAK